MDVYGIPSSKLRICKLENGPVIDDWPIEHGHFPVRYVQ